MSKLNLEKKDFRYGKCPECRSHWEGGVIPKELRKKNNGRYKWSRLIEVEGDCWICPDCQTRFSHREGNSISE